jgi:hypothetical protein
VSSDLQLWAAYLDAVEEAARCVERQVLGRQQPVLTQLPQPAAPWPAALETRRREVLAILASATATVERCRAETGAALAALARPPARPVAGYTDGAALDVLG